MAAISVKAVAGGSPMEESTLSQSSRHLFGVTATRFPASASARSLWFFPSISFVKQCRNDHEVVSKHGSADPELKSFSPASQTTLHASTTEQHRYASFDASSKSLPLLESCRLFVSLAFGRLLASSLRNRHDLHAALLAGLDVLLTKEASIRTVHLWSLSE